MYTYPPTCWCSAPESIAAWSGCWSAQSVTSVLAMPLVQWSQYLLQDQTTIKTAPDTTDQSVTGQPKAGER
jgi:hypothetical protein